LHEAVGLDVAGGDAVPARVFQAQPPLVPAGRRDRGQQFGSAWSGGEPGRVSGTVVAWKALIRCRSRDGSVCWSLVSARSELSSSPATLLDRFGLSGYADTYAGDLSGGQRRLTEIMRALMAEPAMLLLDEPMAGVHPRLARQIGAQLLGLCAEGMTILMVEHELAIMDEFCDPVIVMAEGTVLATGTMAALRSRTEVVEAYLVG
jgi:ABC-type branched-subunit amino acid transport system ATPase component